MDKLINFLWRRASLSYDAMKTTRETERANNLYDVALINADCNGEAYLVEREKKIQFMVPNDTFLYGQTTAQPYQNFTYQSIYYISIKRIKRIQNYRNALRFRWHRNRKLVT